MGMMRKIWKDLEKHIFDPFWPHYWPQNNPFSRHFMILEGPKLLTCNGLKMGSFHLLVHPKWSRIISGKTHF